VGSQLQQCHAVVSLIVQALCQQIGYESVDGRSPSSLLVLGRTEAGATHTANAHQPFQLSLTGHVHLIRRVAGSAAPVARMLLAGQAMKPRGMTTAAQLLPFLDRHQEQLLPPSSSVIWTPRVTCSFPRITLVCAQPPCAAALHEDCEHCIPCLLALQILNKMGRGLPWPLLLEQHCCTTCSSQHPGWRRTSSGCCLMPAVAWWSLWLPGPSSTATQRWAQQRLGKWGCIHA
jgi:hypothetical protein